MNAHVLLNLSNELRKVDKMRGLPSILSLFFATSLTNSIIQEHECNVLFITKTLKLHKNHIFGMKTLRYCHLFRSALMSSLSNITKSVNH